MPSVVRYIVSVVCEVVGYFLRPTCVADSAV